MSGNAGSPPKAAEDSSRNGGQAAEPAAQQLVAPKAVMGKASEVVKPYLRDPKQAVRVVEQIFKVTESFSGPIPHPEILKQYDMIVPGSGREIVDMAKLEQSHRHFIVNLETFYPYFGMLFGFLTLAGCILGAIYLALKDKNGISVTLLGAPVLTAVILFIRSRMTRGENRQRDGEKSSPQGNRSKKK